MFSVVEGICVEIVSVLCFLEQAFFSHGAQAERVAVAKQIRVKSFKYFVILSSF